MSIRAALFRLYWLLRAQLGFDPIRALRFFQGLPRFVRDYFRYRSNYGGRLELLPCLHDWHQEEGATKLEYFWQDLLVAREIFLARPQKHVDIGSRLDGFVAHVASFREIEVFDLRPMRTRVPGVTFRQADLMQPVAELTDYCDSLSCLHALEHFGLGRYGDPVDPRGLERGLANMAALLRTDGVFYLSVPIGVERVEFNGQRVLDPRAMIDLAMANSLELRELKIIREGGKVETLMPDELRLSELASRRYALGMFTFAKRAER